MLFSELRHTHLLLVVGVASAEYVCLKLLIGMRVAYLDAIVVLSMAVGGGLLGSRVLFMLEHLATSRLYSGSVLAFSRGTESWGAYLGGFVGLFGAARLTRHRPLRLLDAASASAGLGIAVGRLDCLVHGDDYGRPSDVPWAVRWPTGFPAHADQVHAGLIDSRVPYSLPVHPTEVYLALSGLALFTLSTALWSRLKDRPGLAATVFWAPYCVARFWLETFRGDQFHVRNCGLTMPQVYSVLTLLVLGVTWTISKSRTRRN